jgi:hypothetical protein
MTSILEREGFFRTIFSRSAWSGKVNYLQQLLFVDMKGTVLIREVVTLKIQKNLTIAK